MKINSRSLYCSGNSVNMDVILQVQIIMKQLHFATSEADETNITCPARCSHTLLEAAQNNKKKKRLYNPTYYFIRTKGRD